MFANMASKFLCAPLKDWSPPSTPTLTRLAREASRKVTLASETWQASPQIWRRTGPSPAARQTLTNALWYFIWTILSKPFIHIKHLIFTESWKPQSLILFWAFITLTEPKSDWSNSQKHSTNSSQNMVPSPLCFLLACFLSWCSVKIEDTGPRKSLAAWPSAGHR